MAEIRENYFETKNNLPFQRLSDKRLNNVGQRIDYTDLVAKMKTPAAGNNKSYK